jgi:hypothetical protein
LREVHLPKSVSKIGKSAFGNCPDDLTIFKEKSGGKLLIQGSKEEVDFIKSHLNPEVGGVK